jgi:hypothetical protein
MFVQTIFKEHPMNPRQILAVAQPWAWPVGLIASSVAAGALAADVASPTTQESATYEKAGRAVAAHSSPRRKDDEKLGERLREGTRLNDVPGSFQFSGDRVTFHPDGGKGEAYKLLENLAMERISSELGRSRGTPNWTVSGMVTEYRNANYLLVTKAVVKTAGETPSTP